MVVPAAISYNGAIATLTPNAVLAPNTLYTAKLKGGTGGVSDIAGNSLAADYTWSFTTAADNCPCTIFGSTTGGSQTVDTGDYELGVKFRTSINGLITGVRFYKPAGSTGTHTGKLWNSNGTLISSATFVETNSGWQEVSFSSPIPVSANTTYIASYSWPGGYYPYQANAFSTTGVTNGPLTVLQSGVDGPNGVYNDTPGLFPQTGGTGANYWVDVVFQTSLPGDTTPPVVSSVNATPGSGGTATITWDTDEPSNSLVEYGTTSGALDLSENNAALMTSHSITLTGLAPSTTYYYKVTSKDAANNSATSTKASFATPAMTLSDTSLADFGAATGNSCSLAQIGDGEVILTPTIGVGFDDTALPAGWSSVPWTTGGTYTVSGGQISVDGARVAPDTYYTSGRSLEFVATFGNNTFQNIGFGQLLETGAEYWAMFGIGSSADSLYVRTNVNNTTVETPIAGGWLGTAHRYQIEWTASQILFYIDGSLVHTANVAITQTMRPVISDYQSGGASVSVDWLHMSPYSSPCSLTSRVFNAGESVIWDTMSWTSTLPAGTSLGISYRIGNTSTPDGSWSGFVPVGSSPASLGSSSRYIQYKADLVNTDTTQTPVLQDVSFVNHPGTDTTPPTVTDRSPAPDTTDINVNSNISVTFSEPTSAATITSSSFRVRRVGDASDVPAATILAGNIATLNPTADLLPLTTYEVTVAASVADLAGNTLGADSAWTFTTEAITVSMTDTTVADFNAGSTLACVVDATIGDGALRLPLTMDEGFSGTALPSGWSGHQWTGGTWTVGSGSLAVDGAYARNDTLFGPGRSLEFVATFKAEAFQHVGFGGSDPTFNDAPIVMFSTRQGTTTLYTSTFLGTYADAEIPNGSSLIGSPHRYRIDWKTDGFDFYVDGALVSSRTSTVSGSMRMAASDYNLGNTSLTVDWMRVTPYVSPCTFESRVLDAGSLVNWLDLSWVGSTPTGTTVGFETRSGNTATPGASWSEWQAVNSPIASPNGQYIQYRAALGTTDLAQTPVIESVSLTYKVVTTPTITWNNPADITYGAALSSVQLNATASVPGTFTYDPTVGTILNAGSHTLHVDFIPTDQETYSTTSKDVTININKATAAVTLGSLTHVYDGTSKSATATTDPIGLTVDITYDDSATVPTNAGNYVVVANINDANYSGTVSGTLTIAKAAATITLADLNQTYDGTQKSVAVITDPTGLTVGVTYEGSSIEPTNAGSYLVIATINDANFTGTISDTLVIAKATAEVTLSGLSHTYNGSAKSATVTTVPEGLPVEVTYDSLPIPPTAVGEYAVVATVTDPNYIGSASGTLIIAQATATHSIDLVPGWNLISFNVHPENTAIATVLSTIAGNYDLVYAWNAGVANNNWLKYAPSAPGYSNTLSSLDEKLGFWIHMSAADTLDVTGSVPVTTNINLSTAGGGWNLVAYPSGADRVLPEALSSNGVGTDFSLVYAYHASAASDPWMLFGQTAPIWANDLTELSPGWGYWVKVSADHAWSVKYLADQ